MGDINLFAMQIDEITYESVLVFCQQDREEDIDLDYKSSWPNDLDRILCAFANTQGGMVLIGIDEINKSRRPKCPPAGVEGSEDMLRQKAINIAFDGIYPPVIPEVQICPIPDSETRSVVVIRISPSRLMHAVDRRSRIYIRVADNNHMYKLASISDLEWLWAQRAKYDEFREQLLENAHKRSNSQSIGWRGREGEVRWFADPRLVLSIVASFPHRPSRIELRSLMDIANKIGVLSSPWKNVYRQVPWNQHVWRSISGGIALFDRGDINHQQYIELSRFGLFYFINTLEPQYVQSPSETELTPPIYISPHIVLSYLDIAVRFGHQFFNDIGYKWPLTVHARIENIQGVLLHHILGPNILDLPELSPACMDETIDLIAFESSCEEMNNKHNELMLAAATSLTWAFGLSWDKAQVNDWFTKLAA